MGKILVIVESPAKSKTLGRYLGSKYEIVASGGHIRDLPPDKLAVDVDNDFEPEYKSIKGKGKFITRLKKAAKKADKLLLASDPDREGEAIAWHIAQILKKNNDEVGRVLFNEITKKAVIDGVANPTKIDMRKVNAQQARRILDRLVGYMVSPFLWKTLYKGLSAGRVQSVALRLICEREQEIEEFVPEEYWHIHAILENKGSQFKAKLAKYKNKKLEIGNKSEVEDIEKKLKQAEFVVGKFEVKDVKKNPYSPFITSSMQLSAARMFGFSASRTMRNAQQLYEGIELGDQGPSGLITYMRTDSVRVSNLAKDQVKSFIKEKYGDEYLKIRHYKSGKSSQDAHEAIRPTDVFKTPESMKKYLTRDQFKLYSIIWKQFVASMMSSAIYEQTRTVIKGDGYELNASQKKLKFDGFQKVMPPRSENGDNDKGEIPKMKKGDICNLVKIDPSQHFTKPPARFTEGTLIKELEDNGVGRPSTYTQIISTLLTRKYVTRDKRSLLPTPLGREVLKLLVNSFPGIFEVGFTADMEEKLDEVEDGDIQWKDVLRDFYEDFEPKVTDVKKRGSEIKKIMEETTEFKCDKCGSPMVKKWSKHGRFLACSAFPDCKNTMPIDEDGNPVEQEKIDRPCPECGSVLTVKHDRRGHRFIACTAYPKCTYTAPYETGFRCPRQDCDGVIVEKYTRKGKVFYGCSNYPNCDFASWDPPVEGPCPECGSDVMFLAVRKTKTTRKCSVCGYSEEINES